jgi:hypothetical protein
MLAQRVAHLAEVRSRLVRSASVAPGTGDLIAYDPGANLADGAAEVESGGFFDCDNSPPWDAWVSFVIHAPRRPGKWTPWDYYLLAWVPTMFRVQAQRGIDVNPEECIVWFSELEARLGV